MIAATYTQGGSFACASIPLPDLNSGDLLLRVEAASICGTDLKIIHNGHRKLREGQRIVLGHEFAGVIEGGPSGRLAGRRVGVAPNWGCGGCEACIRGLANYCPDYSAFGIETDGGHAEYVRLPARVIAQGNVVELPDAVSWEEASLAEPLSCVLQAQRAAGVGVGDRVVVFGCGPMGMLHVLLAAASGASQVIAVAPQGARLEKAEQLGATDVVANDQTDAVTRIREMTGGRGADVVVTAAPFAGLVADAIASLAQFGRLSLFAGLPRQAPATPVDINAIHYKNLQVSGTTGGSNRDYREALRLIESGRVNVSGVISHRVALAEIAQAYQTAMAGAEGKVVLLRNT